MKQLLIFLLSTLLAGAVSAQTPARVRGTITALDGNVVSVKSREGRDLKIELAPDVAFSYMKRLSLADVVVGEYALFALAPSADGRLVATRVQVTKDGVRPPQ